MVVAFHRRSTTAAHTWIADIWSIGNTKPELGRFLRANVHIPLWPFELSLPDLVAVHESTPAK